MARLTHIVALYAMAPTIWIYTFLPHLKYDEYCFVLHNSEESMYSESCYTTPIACTDTSTQNAVQDIIYRWGHIEAI